MVANIVMRTKILKSHYKILETFPDFDIILGNLKEPDEVAQSPQKSSLTKVRHLTMIKL